jgi:hypothetical protein
MCRYAFSGPYKEQFACFDCRKVFKQTFRKELAQKMRTNSEGNRLIPCPECRRPMRNVGRDFHAPRQSDIRQWRKVALLYANGFHFDSCGCGPGYRPATVREVPAFIAAHKKIWAEYERQREKARRKAEKQKR